MHLLVIGLAVAIIAFILWKLRRDSPAPSAANSIESLPAPHNIALSYIADGKLFIRDNTGKTTQIESQYVRDTKARLEREKNWPAGKKALPGTPERCRPFSPMTSLIF
jgi:hypothetical protein